MHYGRKLVGTVLAELTLILYIRFAKSGAGYSAGYGRVALSLSHDWAYQPLCLVGQSPGGCSTCGLVWMPADSIMLVGATERATSKLQCLY